MLTFRGFIFIFALSSACTCPNTPASEHPGPSFDRGRGAPEIDVLEAQKNKMGAGGRVSQSAQFAPFSYNYTFDTTQVEVYDPTLTLLNPYRLVTQAHHISFG